MEEDLKKTDQQDSKNANDESNTDKKIFVSILSNITILGILIYYLGWKYWEAYYSYFGIQSSLIEISFEKIIITTWSRIIGLLLIFFIFWEDFWKKKQNEYAIGPISIALSLIVLGHIDFEYSIYIQLAIVIISVVAYLILRKREFTYSTVSRTKFLSFLGVFIYLFGIFYYAKNGKKEAQKFYNHFEDNINITTSNGEFISGKLITFMSGKFFLVTEDFKCKKHIIIVEESQIITSELISNIETASNRVDGSAPNGTECASHTTERTGHVLGGSQSDGLSSR